TPTVSLLTDVQSSPFYQHRGNKNFYIRDQILFKVNLTSIFSFSFEILYCMHANTRQYSFSSLSLLVDFCCVYSILVVLNTTQQTESTGNKKVV
ncbi:unnamed protein product, partial [Ixodes pacificus]